MNDADRLRQAAQMLEITGFLGVDADPLVKQRENLERNAVAAVLLAIANDRDLYFPLSRETAAAVKALANRVLGEPNE